MNKLIIRQHQLITLFTNFVLIIILGFSYNSFANTSQNNDLTNIAVDRPKIQLAVLLDTSSSMNGLIDQARNQLWQVVNEFSSTTKDGVIPTLEVAVYEYGNSGLSSSNGHIRQVIALSSDLDSVSEALFSLTTNGGDEYCGYVIDTATRELQWSSSDNDIKAIFIAGNEPFTQGPLPYTQAIKAALAKGIVVNTIHAGDHHQGIASGWQQGAVLAAGNYMSIDHNQQIAHIIAPQDKKLAELNQQLNQTYIPYGNEGAKGASRQQQQDSKSSSISLGLLAKRVKAKVSSMYSNAEWDLVDALNSNQVDLDDIEAENLPEPMKAMNKQEQLQYVQEQKRTRNDIKDQIATLDEARREYVKEEESKLVEESAPTMNDALSSAIRTQGEKKNFSFSDK